MFQQYYPNNVAGFMAPNRPQARFTQPVTAEMSKMVLTNDDELSVKISPTEKIKNMCTHKYPGTQNIALVKASGPNIDQNDPANNDLVTCRVCGETFHMKMDTTADEIERKAQELVDILQSAKTIYLDAPEEFVKEYFQIITLLKRVPKVFTKSANNWVGYEVSTNPLYVSQNLNSFQHVNSMVGGFNMGGINPMGMMGVPQVPNMMYQQPVAQPQQQWAYNQFGQMVPVVANVAPNENPLMYSPPTPQAPVMAPPVAPAPGVTPATVAPAPAAPANPAAQTGEVVQTKAFSV